MKIQLAFGKQEFKRVWGNRKNEDNWRWESVKTNVLGSTEIAENFQENTDSLNVFRPDFYISQIPTEKTIVDSIKTDRNYAYYQLGLIYKEKFKEYKLSKNRFQNLLKNNPEEKLILPSKYNLYKINEILNEGSQMAFYKDDIIANYPDSRYAKLLLNPDVSSGLDKESPEYLYAKTYKLLETQQFEEVITKTEEYSAFFGEDAIAPKFQLLRATAIGRLRGYNAYTEALNSVATDYANTAEGEQAKKLITSLLRVKDTSFVEAGDLKKFKAIYIFNKNEFSQIEGFKKQLNLAVQNISYYDLTVSEDVYNLSTNFVVVHGITSIQGAKGFDLILKENNSRSKELRKDL